MLELQIECTKQNQKNATFDLDLFSSSDSHKTNWELFSWLTVLNKFPQNIGENMYFYFFFPSKLSFT